MTPSGKIQVRVVIEGGGPDGPFRNGFKTFFHKFVLDTIGGRPVSLEIVRGKNGEEAGKKFIHQQALFPQALMILLVDSEFPVPGNIGIWSYLIQRKGFVKPDWADDSQVFLMVQCIETWIVADREALKSKYKKLNDGKLPRRINLEEESKADVQKKLKEATEGAYAHSDCCDLIRLVSRESIEKLAHGGRLIDQLVATIHQFAQEN